MDIMAGQIQANQELKEQAPAWPSRAEEYKQAGCRAAISDHIQHGAKLGRLLEIARSDSVEGVEEAGDAVEDGARAGVEGHVVEGAYGEDDAGVAWRFCQQALTEVGGRGRTNEVGVEEEDVLFRFRAFNTLLPGRWSRAIHMPVHWLLFFCSFCSSLLSRADAGGAAHRNGLIQEELSWSFEYGTTFVQKSCR